ncbi:exodeoxyribonuclease VII large subunit [Secundilactobacillus malefermentans DSM 5705 = KCTC 3548]|nr:exodeoxyribonuclease VII large subunit [Secundilactobacillus malefermentans]KRM59627.1 exodeoxyribonuclease VII large subunit [Secundilactobacillus malefermentans DSM 5705 = KCTC 3548]QEA32462.1 exodeoxyribonuclease VII large subunit [Secundilactobacillus malefermentans]
MIKVADDYLTVSALTQYLKRKFDVDPYLNRVYLTGEISNFRLRRNAHQYFSIKDDHAKISAIMFKSAFEKIKFEPEEGMKVLVTGRISLYEQTGNYQIYVDHMEPDGVGQFYQAYEQLKKKLDAEGLFTAPKKPLVQFPKRIAVVTSPSGAVIRDIITTTRRRFPISQIVLFPAIVQGNDAADNLVQQINRINDLGTFDTMIVGRGGGSIEDLWPFNEERVARAIFNSKIPVISSVGHETDTTIADLVADVRAATPTAAAELAVPVLSDLVANILQMRTRLVSVMQSRLTSEQQRLTKLSSSYIFQQPERLYQGYSQNVDLLRDRLKRKMQTQLNGWEHQISLIHQRLYSASPTDSVRRANQTLRDLNFRQNRAIKLELENKKRKFTDSVSRLDALSPLRTMSRGYGYLTENGKVLKTTNDLKLNQKVTIQLIDGTAKAKIEQIETTKGEK